jgi:hypothetical protein
MGFIGESNSINGVSFTGLEEGIDLLIGYMQRELICPSHWKAIHCVRGEWHHYEGNFLRVSLLFKIATIDPAIYEKLDAAITEHFQSERFTAAIGDYIRGTLAGADDSRQRLGRVGEGLADAAECEVAELRKAYPMFAAAEAA